MDDNPDNHSLTVYKRVADMASIEQTKYKGLGAEFASYKVNDIEYSTGIFSVGDKPVVQAWGVKSEPHCGAHRVMLAAGQWSPPIIGCPVARASSTSGSVLDLQYKGNWLPY